MQRDENDHSDDYVIVHDDKINRDIYFPHSVYMDDDKFRDAIISVRDMALRDIERERNIDKEHGKEHDGEHDKDTNPKR